MSIKLDKKVTMGNDKSKIDEDLWIAMEYNDILYIISKTVRDYRKEHNLSQKELGEMIRMSQPMVRRMESGEYNPSVKFLVKMWNKLSTNEENFAKILIDKIYDRVNKNYEYSIKIRYEYQDIEEEYENVLDKREMTFPLVKKEYNIPYDDKQSGLQLAS